MQASGRYGRGKDQISPNIASIDLSIFFIVPPFPGPANEVFLPVHTHALKAAAYLKTSGVV